MMVAGTYPSLLDATLEQVQNALDAKATLIGIRINLKKRGLDIVDNGQGVTRVKFEQCLTQIGKTVKSRDKMGRWGRGMISYLGKCEKFTFTSCHYRKTPGQTGFLEWTFDTGDIGGMSDTGAIPLKERPQIKYHATRANPKRHRSGDSFFVPWRTRIKAWGIIKDRTITRMTAQDLAEQILDKFGPVMRKLDTVVQIDFISEDNVRAQLQVVAKEYEGRPLDEAVYVSEDCGETRFRVFIAKKTPRGARKGSVCFGEIGDDFRIPSSSRSFWNSIDGILSDGAIQALRSGIFEGEIACQGVELDAGRKRFVANDALVGMCVCIERWFEDIGQKHLDIVESHIREARFQKLGLRALKVVEGLLDSQGLRDLIKEFKVGTIGAGHKKAKPVGRQKKKSVATRGNQDKANSEAKGESRGEPDTDLPEHQPGTVTGPEGHRRQLVRGHSTGLQLDFDEVGTSGEPFKFDMKTGVLTFNTSHRYWFECEETDTSLMRYIETVATFAISQLMLSNDDNEAIVGNVISETLSFMVHNIVHGDRLSGRRRTSSAKKS
ncbi:hypothetical protein HOB10_01010 [Candidatus Parcubacteria bacterium]|nr:hypothetical protein [Candidatus Parcubacteria bacterium]